MRQEQDVRGFWNRTYDRLLERGLTVGDLATSIGVSYNIIPNWKSKGRYPQVEYLMPMSEFLGISIDYLLTGEERPKTIPPRLQAIVDTLSNDEGKLAAVETLLGIEKKAGSSGIKAG